MGGAHRTHFEALFGLNLWTADCFWMRCRRSERQCPLYPSEQTILRAGDKVRFCPKADVGGLVVEFCNCNVGDLVT